MVRELGQYRRASFLSQRTGLEHSDSRKRHGRMGKFGGDCCLLLYAFLVLIPFRNETNGGESLWVLSSALKPAEKDCYHRS